MGAPFALPLLDAMVPAMTALGATTANPVRRLGFVYVPMGAHIPQWTPPGSGRLTELSPTLLSLAPFVDQLTVIRSEEHTSELQSRLHLVCRLLLEKKKSQQQTHNPGT